jgi:hypothetical protein
MNHELSMLTVSQDLSLLTHLTEEDIRNLQTVGKDAQEARSKFILKDDQHAVWNHVKTLKDAQVDFVLDNGTYSPLLLFYSSQNH